MYELHEARPQIGTYPTSGLSKTLNGA